MTCFKIASEFPTSYDKSGLQGSDCDILKTFYAKLRQNRRLQICLARHLECMSSESLFAKCGEAYAGCLIPYRPTSSK